MNANEIRQINRVKRNLRAARVAVDEGVDDVTFSNLDFLHDRFNWEALLNSIGRARLHLDLVHDLIVNTIAEVPLMKGPDDAEPESRPRAE